MYMDTFQESKLLMKMDAQQLWSIIFWSHMKCRHCFLLLAFQSVDTVEAVGFQNFTMEHTIFYPHLLPMDVAPGSENLTLTKRKKKKIIIIIHDLEDNLLKRRNYSCAFNVIWQERHLPKLMIPKCQKHVPLTQLWGVPTNTCCNVNSHTFDNSD